MIKISSRLLCVANMVPCGSNAMDIGCDHGLLSIYLYENKIVNKIIATDINENALGNAINNINKYNVDIETRLGNGIEVLKDTDNIDTLIIAGMGSHTIIGMFLNNRDKLKNIENIIIQSNTKLDYLRYEMTKLGYIIVDEDIVVDSNKYYIVIKFSKGKKKYNKRELFLGPILIEKNSELFNKYKDIELKKLLILIKMLPKNKIIDRYKLKKKISLYK